MILKSCISEDPSTHLTTPAISSTLPNATAPHPIIYPNFAPSPLDEEPDEGPLQLAGPELDEVYEEDIA